MEKLLDDEKTFYKKFKEQGAEMNLKTTTENKNGTSFCKAC